MLTTKLKVPIYIEERFTMYLESFYDTVCDSQDLYIHLDIDHSCPWNRSLKERLLDILHNVVLKEYGEVKAYVTNPKQRKYVRIMGFTQIEKLPELEDGTAQDIWSIK